MLGRFEKIALFDAFRSFSRFRDGARAFRAAEVGAVNEEKRTVELAFSSEVEVPRWYGLEVLSHDPAAVVLSRLKDGAPLLLEHDCDDQIGVVETVSIDADRRGRAVVRCRGSVGTAFCGSGLL